MKRIVVLIDRKDLPWVYYFVSKQYPGIVFRNTACKTVAGRAKVWGIIGG